LITWGLEAPIFPRWMRGQSTAFDEPRTAVSNYMLTEGSGLGTINKPPVATDITVDPSHSFFNSNSSHIMSSKAESNRIRQVIHFHTFDTH